VQNKRCGTRENGAWTIAPDHRRLSQSDLTEAFSQRNHNLAEFNAWTLLHRTPLPKVQITRGFPLTSIKPFACTYQGHSLGPYH